MSEFYKLRPRAILDACHRLKDPVLVAVYRTVLDRIYEVDGPCRDAPDYLGPYVGIGAARCARALDELVRIGKLDRLDDGSLINHVAAAELERRAGLSATRSAAGKQGGRGHKTSAKPSPNERDTRVGRSSQAQTARVLDEETAENSQAGKAFASTRARESEKIREEPPSPPKRGAGLDRVPPTGFDEALTADERAEKIRSISGTVDRDPLPDEVDIQQLQGRIMTEAKMVVPPIDLILVDSWVRLGLNADEITKTAIRMSAVARSPVRGMRYFDAEMRRLAEAKSSCENETIADFRRIAAQYAS